MFTHWFASDQCRKEISMRIICEGVAGIGGSRRIDWKSISVRTLLIKKAVVADRSLLFVHRHRLLCSIRLCVRTEKIDYRSKGRA